MDRPLHGRIRTTDDKNFHPMNGRGRWTKTDRQTSWTYSEDAPLKIKECGRMGEQMVQSPRRPGVDGKVAGPFARPVYDQMTVQFLQF